MRDGKTEQSKKRRTNQESKRSGAKTCTVLKVAEEAKYEESIPVNAQSISKCLGRNHWKMLEQNILMPTHLHVLSSVESRFLTGRARNLHDDGVLSRECLRELKQSLGQLRLASMLQAPARRCLAHVSNSRQWQQESGVTHKIPIFLRLYSIRAVR